MSKIIFWFLVILFALFATRLLVRSQSAATRQTPAPRPKGNHSHPEAMVQCAHCGIHLPRSEAVLIKGQTWCSQDHAKLGTHQ